MNKSDLIDYVAEKVDQDVTKTLVTQIVDTIFEGISGELQNGGEAKFVGFGTFKVSHRKATTGRNPQTGEPIQIKASNRVKFSPGKDLKEAVNK